MRSPSSRIGLIAEKTLRYLQAGSHLVLDVDPQKRTIVAHAQSGERLYSEQDLFEHEAVPWLVFEVAEVFALLKRERATP